MYPATIPILFTFIYTAAHIFLKFENGARNIVIAFSVSVALMIGNFIYKLL